ncbi:MAG: 2-hydroxyacyl-CoA dehydratase [Firmicutes bacterium]|nr:2-hydroxyacyl-CoA dehydratase [Bacillota bacterium]
MADEVKKDAKKTERLKAVYALKAWESNHFQELQEKVKGGSPFCVCNVDEAEEIMVTFGIPCITTQWWSSQISAKKMSKQYFEALAKRGYDMDHYYSLGLACTVANDPETAPWGGLPKPTLIVGSPQLDQTNSIKELWAKEFGCPYFEIECVGEDVMPAPEKWWEKSRDNWDELIPKHVLDLKEQQLREMISFVETLTGKPFDYYEFERTLEVVNEQADYYRKTRDLCAHTIPCPVGIRDQFSLVSMQWHRGNPEVRDMAKGLYEEVKERVESGFAVCKDEKIRLFWATQGLWSNTQFYNAFMEKYGAVFVASMYMSIPSDGYYRAIKGNALRALASRQILLGVLDPNWLAKEAKNYMCDGAVGIGTGRGKSDIAIAFEKAGIPYLELSGDNVDARNWDEEANEAAVARFIEERILSVPESERRKYKD